MTAQTPPRTRIALLLVVFGLASLLSPPVVTADPVMGGTGSTRTITWLLNDTAGLGFDRIAVENGSAVLDWASADIDWSRGPHFAANGTLDPSVSAGVSGIELAADPTNHISDGDFAALGAWELSPTQNVSVVREAIMEDVYLGNASSPSPQVIFNALDTVDDPNWTSTGSSGSVCNFDWVAPDQSPPGSMIRCTVTLGSPLGSSAGIAWPAADWSGFDRLLLWVYAEDPSPLSWSFQLTAVVSGVPQVTPLQPLHVGWQEIVVNLTTLGPDLTSLTNIRFLVVGQFITGKSVSFDEIRLTTVRSFDETGRLRQSFSKGNITSSSPGSAILAFDYRVVDNSGIDSFGLSVNFSGMGRSQVATVPVVSPGSWTRYFTDVSSISTASGTYSVEFLARIEINATGPSNAAVRIDNVSVEFPNRTEGSFLSDVIDYTLVSQITAVRWSATIPFQTTAMLRLRTGNETYPSGPSWSGWRTWDTAGAMLPGLGPSRYLQLALDLYTSNASRTPFVDTVQIDARHRSATGSIETDFELQGEDSFGSWKFMEAHTTDPGGGEVTLFVDRANGWDPVPPNGVLSQATSNSISWRVVLITSSGLTTPRLSSIVLTYERSLIPGYVANVFLNPYFLAGLTAATIVGYSTYAIVRRRSFALDDLFLISREGRLMMHNTRRMRPDRDEDILSGMLTAILAFVKDSDPEGNGELHNFKIGDKTTVVEKGMHSYVAAVYSGMVPRWAAKDLRRFLNDLEAEFGSAFAQWSGDPEDLQGLHEFTARFVSRIRYRPPNGASGRAA